MAITAGDKQKGINNLLVSVLKLIALFIRKNKHQNKSHHSVNMSEKYPQPYDQPPVYVQQPGIHPQVAANAAYTVASGETVTVQPLSQPFAGYNPAQVPVGCPPGLEFLAGLNKVSIIQVLHAVEVLTGWERNNQYRICNEQDQQFLHAKEDTDCMTRQCLGQLRPFHIDISNMSGQPLIQLDRPLNCQGCCCPCCLQEMDICSPPGNKIATVKEKWTLCVPEYEVYDLQNQLLFKIVGDCCYCKCCTDVTFKVIRADGSDAGDITKHWRGCEEMCGQVNNFSCNYAPNETPLNKVILLGATFLVDYMYFEVKN